MHRRLPLGVLLVLQLACAASSSSTSDRCETVVDCAAGQRCVDRRCVLAGDASTEDARAEDAGADGLPLDEFAAAQANATCSSFARCLGRLADGLVGGDCVTFLTQQFEQGALPRLEEVIADGRLRYDAVAARRCVEQLERAACDALSERTLECEMVFQGSATVGAACGFAGECTSDAYCDLSVDCAGVCRVRSGAGGACNFDDACQRDLACVDGRCMTLAGLGAPCDEDRGSPCRNTLLCLEGTCTTFDRASTAELGAPCDSTRGLFCREGLSCVLDEFVVVTETYASRCVGPSASGGVCKPGFPEPCPSGEACDLPDEYTRDMLVGICRPRPVAGQPCSFSGLCAAGLRCVDEICTAPANLGATCRSDLGCYSGECTGGVCVTPTLECEG